MRDRDTPRLLSPGIASTLAAVTTEPKVVLVAFALAMMSDKKSEAFAFEASLQVNPFTFTPVCNDLYGYYHIIE